MTFISETWLTNTVTSSMLDPRQLFNIYRCDRDDRRGGGVCALIPKSFKSHLHVLSDDDKNLLDNSDCEILAIDVQLLLLKYRLIVIYRPPSSSFSSNADLIAKTLVLKKLINNLTHPVINTIIVGDLNLPKINWIDNEYSCDDVHDVLFHCFSSLGYVQFVNGATRFSRLQTENILDIILCNNAISINVDNIGAPISTSDHAIIHFSIFVSNTGSSFTDPPNSPNFGDNKISLPSYDWSSANFEAINNFIETFDWHNLFGYFFDADSLWEEFKNILWPVISLNVPQKLILHNKKYRQRFYPKNIRHLLNRKAAIWRQLKLHKTDNLISKYQSVANQCKLEILNYDASREKKLLESKNLGTFYKFVNNKIGNPSGIAPLKTDSNILITSDYDRANLLNKYFESVFTTDDGTLPPFPARLAQDVHSINDINISPEIVKYVLKNLKTNSAAGPDAIPPIFFHHTSRTISGPLSILLRSFVNLHSLPSEWKLSVIVPKFKKGSPSCPSNYRPIALTCTCCKILESIIATQLTQFLFQHHLITRHQHGFLKRHSTSTNLLETINDWTISLNNHKSVSVAYIDFKSAFDCISHSKLILKLSSYGIKGTLLFWIQAFLSNRTQIVKINQTLSTPCKVSSGVPQGSVLGPLLFTLYINDITDNLDPSATIKLFADDVKLYSEFSNISPTNLQTYLDYIAHWAFTWQLNISHQKCNILTLGKHTISNTLLISNQPIPIVDSVKDLGIFVDSDLKFTRHIDDIVSKAKQRSSLIHRCFLSRNPSNLLRAYKTYIRPIVEYASTTWSPTYVYHICLLESVQRNFTKRIPGCCHLAYADRLTKLNLLTLEHRRLIADLVMCFNIIKDNNCLLTEDFFKINPNQNLRGHSLKLSFPVANLNVRKFFFSNRIISIWNSLPSNLVLSPSPTSFKRQLAKLDLSKFLTIPYVQT